MGLLDFLKAKPKRSQSEAPNSPVSYLMNNKKQLISYSEAVLAEDALKHPVLYRVLNKIALSVQSVEWYVEKDKEKNSDRVGSSQLKAIQAVLDYPNDILTADQLRYWIAMNYAVYGRAVFKIGQGVEKNPNAIYPLESQYVTRILNQKGMVDYYEYGSLSEKNRIPTRKAFESLTTSSGYAYEIFIPSLSGNLAKACNTSPLASLALPTQVITLLLQRAVDTASGHPNAKYVIVAERSLTNPQKESLREHLENMETGSEESGHTLILYNTKVEIHKLDNNLTDIHSKVPLDDMARMIAGAYGIPVSLLGLAASDGAKFAGNYIESRRSFWEDTIIPGYLTPIATGMTAALCPPGCRIRFDLDSIPALQDSRVSRAKELTLVSFLEQNEKREISGWPPTDKIIAPSIPGVAPSPVKNNEEDSNDA